MGFLSLPSNQDYCIFSLESLCINLFATVTAHPIYKLGFCPWCSHQAPHSTSSPQNSSKLCSQRLCRATWKWSVKVMEDLSMGKVQRPFLGELKHPWNSTWFTCKIMLSNWTFRLSFGKGTYSQVNHVKFRGCKMEGLGGTLKEKGVNETSLIEDHGRNRRPRNYNQKK